MSPTRTAYLFECHAFVVLRRTEGREFPGASVVLDTDEPRDVILARVLDIFMRYRNWEKDMDRSCISNEGLQSLLDISESFLVNHVVIIDSTLKLIGATRHIECDEEITVELLAHGYHTESNIKKFHEYVYLDIWSKCDDFIIDRSLAICKHPSMIYSFKQHGVFSMLVVMMCNNADPEQWLIDTYDMLIRRVAFYFDRDYPSGKPSGSTVTDSPSSNARNSSE